MPKEDQNNVSATSEIFNGAKCKTYSWSQSHSDLEIRVKLNKPIKYENINVSLTKFNISVEICCNNPQKNRNDPIVMIPIETLMEGVFEHPVDVESAFWLLEKDDPCIVVYVDKQEELWWKQLLLNEEVTEEGQRNYTVSMEHLDDGSRMVIDKLIVEQRNKMLPKQDEYYSPA